MTDTELDALEAKAKAATPGPWEYDIEQGEYHGVWADGCYIVPSLHIDADNCKYIAAVNPTVVLELIAELRQTKAEREWICQEIEETNNRIKTSDALCCPNEKSGCPYNTTCYKCWLNAAKEATHGA